LAKKLGKDPGRPTVVVVVVVVVVVHSLFPMFYIDFDNQKVRERVETHSETGVHTVATKGGPACQKV